ncbi:hypothetical protein [Streptomyces sp. NPDC052225]|uniref:hypothetical protein n=1 Tax=Streptomyces sp. NPDC052225 TaxID=3154949 RepID=UPI0034409E53
MTYELAAEPVIRTPARSRQWIAPLVSTLVTLPAAFFAYLFAGLSGMACDSCTDAQLAAFDPSFARAFTVLGWGLFSSVLVLLTAWLLPWQERFAARRIGFALAAPCAVVLTYVVFLVMVDWP